MRNPLKKLFKDRGYPDSHHVHDGNSSSSLAVVPSSAPPPPSSALSLPLTQPPLPAGYPSINNPHYMVQTPTAYPDQNAPQEDSEQVWEIDSGNNKNLKGNQKTGNVKAANSAAGSPPAINVPRRGRFVINTGGNTNHGDVQETGDVDFANVG